MSSCKNLKSLSYGCLKGCSKLKKLILPPFITTIFAGSLSDIGVSSLSIPETVTKIDDTHSEHKNSISNCPNLFKIIWEGLPQIRHIGCGAFYNSPLTSFRICKNLKFIGSEAIYGSKIKEFIVDDGNTEFSTDGKCVTNIQKNIIFFFRQN